MNMNLLEYTTCLLLICTVFASVVALWVKSRRTIKSCSTVKLMPLLSFAKLLLGKNIKDLRIKILEMRLSVCVLNDCKRFATFNEASVKYAFFFKPETIQVLLNSSVAIDKAKEYILFHPWLGTGLLTSSKNKWRARRKLLTPAFHFSILKDFIPVFNEHSQTLVQKLSSLVAADCVDIVPVITLCTLDIICETAMGVHMHTQHGHFGEYVQAINEIANAFFIRSINPLLSSDVIYHILPSGWRFRRNLKLVHDFTRKMIKEKKEFHIKNQRSSSAESDISTKKKAFLELLLEHHYLDETFTEEDIREEVDTFMFEGHDTTATAISWTLYCLGLYPKIQDDVYRELKSIFQDDPERAVTSKDLGNMNHLERVIKETLRLYPPVPLIARKLKDNINVLNNIVTPDFSCLVDFYALHRDEKHFPNPEQFDPNRFLPENTVNMHPFAYTPFSAGPRNCIGQKFALIEVKIVLAHVLRNFKVVSLDQRDKIRLMWGFILKSADPLRIKFLTRNME